MYEKTKIHHSIFIVEKKSFDFYVLFLCRANSPERPLLDLNLLPTNHKTRVLINAPPMRLYIMLVCLKLFIA